MMLSLTLWMQISLTSLGMVRGVESTPGDNGLGGREYVSFKLSTSSASLKKLFRLKQGLFGGRWYYKLFNVVLFFGGLVTACLGKPTFLLNDFLDFAHCN